MKRPSSRLRPPGAPAGIRPPGAPAGIRPPGAPGSLRPPASAHGAPGSLLTRLLRPPTPSAHEHGPRPGGSHPSSPGPRAGLRAARPSPSAPHRHLRRAQVLADRLSRLTATRSRMTMLLAATAVTLTITLTAAALADMLGTPPHGDPALSAAPPTVSHRTTPSPTTAATTATPASAPSADASWQQVWTTDIDQFSPKTADTRVNDDYLIVYDQKDGTHPRLHGYSLWNGTPQEIWSRDSTDGLVALTSSALVTYNRIIDPATGEDIEVPWDRKSTVMLATEDTIITCLYPTPTCTGWDLDEGEVSLRWGPVDLPGQHSPSFSLGVTPLGHPVVEGSTAAQIFNGQGEDPSVVFISLTDGRITATRDPGSVPLDLIPAADGWIWLQGGASEQTAVSLAPDGTQIESYTVGRGFSTLLLTESGVPTLEQYKAAFSLGDTSWATVSLHCKTRSTCSNRQDLITGGDAYYLSPFPVFYLGTTVSTYQNYLIIGDGVSHRYGRVRILDLDDNRMVRLPPPLLDDRAKVTIARDGLLIAITESGLAAYAPAQ